MNCRAIDSVRIIFFYHNLSIYSFLVLFLQIRYVLLLVKYILTMYDNYMYKELFEKIGVSEKQSNIYIELLENGPRTAKDLSQRIKESRTNTYNLLQQLEEFGLVRRSVLDGIFSAASPVEIKKIVNKKNSELQQINNEVTLLMPKLTSLFKLSHNEPGVLHMRGIESFKILYNDILRANKKLRLIPSPEINKSAALMSIVNEQIIRQKELGVSVQSMMGKNPNLTPDRIQYLTDNGVDIRLAPELSYKVQLMIYGNSIAYVANKEEPTITIITSDEISELQTSIFDSMWENIATPICLA